MPYKDVTFSLETQEAVYKNSYSLWHQNEDAEVFPKQNLKNQVTHLKQWHKNVKLTTDNK